MPPEIDLPVMQCVPIIASNGIGHFPLDAIIGTHCITGRSIIASNGIGHFPFRMNEIREVWKPAR